MADEENNPTREDGEAAPVMEQGGAGTETATEAESPAPEASPDAEAAPAVAAPAVEPEPQLSGKEARARDRQREASARPARTPEERQADRRAVRAVKAVARRRRRQQEKARGREAGRIGTGTGTEPAAPQPGTPQVRMGTVTSAKADKTITVRIDMARRHRRYEKIVRSSSTLAAHDETNDAHEGDRVRVVESRPLSRTKRWRLAEVLERAK